ncbi:MAG: aromatic ring-hydroxylating dioxygenase subunit alpha [Chthonomonas sp.]|nr:aromatic ring-hydroxylating dioxygenase subunit alpha [Chthonomonas sp.]
MSDSRFFVDPDIRKASTLPAEFYSDTEIWESAKESVFGSSWQWIGDSDPVKIPGQVWPFTLLPGVLDEPLLLTRDSKDQLRCLSNVCTHRGMLVCEGAGNERYLRCRYHGRRFGLDGQFQHMPEFEGVEGFPTEADHLPQVPLEAFGPYLFTSLTPVAPFSEVFGPIVDRLGWLPLHEFRYVPEESRDYVVKSHWALYVDNYLEGFHIPFIHAALNETVDYDTYATELYPYANLQLAESKDGQGVFDLPPSSPDFGRAISAYYWWVFPNLMLNFYPWGLSVNVVRPLAQDLTRVSFIRYVWGDRKPEGGAGADLDRVEREDEVVVEAVQRGLRSRYYDRGRFSPLREIGTHHFHRLLAESIRTK